MSGIQYRHSEKSIKKSNPQKAIGYDQIQPRILKEGAEQLTVPIA